MRTLWSRAGRGILCLATAAAIVVPVHAAASADVGDVVVASTTSPGYSETGTWSSSKYLGYDQQPNRFTRQAGATATWTLTAPETGEFELAAWYAASDINDPAASYTWEPGRADPLTVDQTHAGDAWYTLGQVALAAGQSLRVTVTARTDGDVTRADAVRLRPLPCQGTPAPGPDAARAGRHATYTLAENPSTITVSTPGWRMDIQRDGFRYGFAAHGTTVAPAHPVSGLQMATGDGGALCDAATTRVVAAHATLVQLDVGFAGGRHATVVIAPTATSVNLRVTPEDGVGGPIRARLAGGMSPVYGLGDLGGQGSQFNRYGVATDRLSSQQEPWTTAMRFVSTFAVFPSRHFAEVVLDNGVKAVAVDDQSTMLGVDGSAMPGLYYFLGDLDQIYGAYQRVRHAAGYADAKPTPDLFGVGYESYGALAYNTNQATITESVRQYLDRGYPISWAVTGSGFWPTAADGNQGTTNSFGMWGAKYPDPEAYKQFFASHGIKLILGLRQSFKALPADGGAYDPAVDGPWTQQGLDRGYFLADASGAARVFTPISFPASKVYLLDTANPRAVDWFVRNVAAWGAAGFKEDHMADATTNKLVDDNLVNPLDLALAGAGSDMMVRNAAYSVPGSILRLNDTDYNQGAHDRDRAVMTGLSYAASGEPNFYPDIVGGRPMADLATNTGKQWYLARNAMMAAVSPSMSFGNEPWQMSDPTLVDATVAAARWHDTYTPYIYSAAVDSWRTGYPETATPLPIAFPDDPATYDLDAASDHLYEWMLGPSLLVAPVYGSGALDAGARDVYLPRGEWMDPDTGQRFTGPVTLKDYPMPPGKVPAFVGGASTLIEKHDGGLRARVFPTATRGTTYRYTATDGTTTSTIRMNNVGWSPDTLSVVEQGGGRVPVSVDAATGAVCFDLRPGRSYQLVGGGGA